MIIIIIVDSWKFGYYIAWYIIFTLEFSAMSVPYEQGRVFSLYHAKPGDLVRVTDVKASKLLKKRLVSMGYDR